VETNQIERSPCLEHSIQNILTQPTINEDVEDEAKLYDITSPSSQIFTSSDCEVEQESAGSILCSYDDDVYNSSLLWDEDEIMSQEEIGVQPEVSHGDELNNEDVSPFLSSESFIEEEKILSPLLYEDESHISSSYELPTKQVEPIYVPNDNEP